MARSGWRWRMAHAPATSSEFGHRECVLCFEHGLKESNPFKNLFLIDAGKLAGDRAVRWHDVAIKCWPSELT